MKRFLLILSLAIAANLLYGQEQTTKETTESDLSIIFESGLMIGHSDGFYPAPFTCNISFLKNFNHRVWLGGGSGAEIIGKTFIPVYADFRVTPFASKPFFLYEKVGWTICTNKNYSEGESNNNYYYNIYPHPLNENVLTHGGLMNEIGCGILLNNTNWATSFSIGYKHMKTKDEIKNSTKTYENAFNRLTVRVGFWF